jgi:NAD(P)-dependent dehydrogenase (short-subunit alcohol dehydrogenase family)
MNIFQDKVAVITGAASGIGFALAARCVKEQVKVVLADVEPTALSVAEERLRQMGGTVLAVQTDVTKADQVENLAEQTLRAFGSVHLLFNNAGVASGGPVWETSPVDWDWVVGVNIGGVVNCLRTFVPIMLQKGEEGHIVNTASVVGLVSYHPCASYQMSKAAVVALSENLYHALNFRNTKLGVSVLCPGWVKTHILDAERNHPDQAATGAKNAEEQIVRESFKQAIENGMSPDEVAKITFIAIQKKQFYIFPDPTWQKKIKMHLEDIIHSRNPASARALADFLGDPRTLAKLAANSIQQRLTGRSKM